MARRRWSGQRFAAAAERKNERVRNLVEHLRERQKPANSITPDALSLVACATAAPEVNVAADDADLDILTQTPSEDLRYYVELLDRVVDSQEKIHIALLWPHLPPRSILPWMLREVSRGRQTAPARTLFLNMGRAALQTMAGIEARTARLHARGLYRAGVNSTSSVVGTIGPDAHFYLLLGDTRDSGITSIPLISIVPHTIALNDGIFWRDFDEKTLKGFKRYFPANRLSYIRSKYLDLLTSAARSPAFAFLLPAHFPDADRREALARIQGGIDLAIIDMSTQALGGRDPNTLLWTLLTDLEQHLEKPPKHVLIVTDCPLYYSFLRSACKKRRNTGPLGTRFECHRLIWASRDRGFGKAPQPLVAAPPIVETIASQECVIATRLWEHARELEDGNPLAPILRDGAAALKGMALTATTADILLAPYTDVHDAYHRIKRERHSFAPHYNKAMSLVAEGKAGPWREAIEADLRKGLACADELRKETPLMRYLKRVLSETTRNDDVLVSLRHPEDVQQANDVLLDFLTAPGSFPLGVPNLRVTTGSRYAAEVAAKLPTVVIWAASAMTGARAYVGDTFAPKEFRLVVAGQDANRLSRTLNIVIEANEYSAYHPRVSSLKNALPWAPKDFGGISAALALDPDRARQALPFSGQGYLELDGYGKVAASPGSQFYVLDPVSQELHPREARSIDEGDAVFVMSDSIREEIEALLREKDELGRTLEQALVDQYKAIVRKGIETLSEKYGSKGLGTRIHALLFEQNRDLPPIGVAAVDYWLQAAEHTDVDTPYAARYPLHLEAFLRVMGAGVMARPLADAVRIVRSDLQRDGHTNRAIFDRLLLDPDSLIHSSRRVTYDKLQGFRNEALENVFPVLAKHFETASTTTRAPRVRAG